MLFRSRQFKPSAAIPAFCIAGDAECLIGCPKTAQKRVEALTGVVNGSDTRVLYAGRAVVGRQNLPA